MKAGTYGICTNCGKKINPKGFKLYRMPNCALNARQKRKKDVKASSIRSVREYGFSHLLQFWYSTGPGKQTVDTYKCRPGEVLVEAGRLTIVHVSTAVPLRYFAGS
jgi:hypothetical protein